MTLVAISLGSNLGDREANLLRAVQRLRQIPQVSEWKLSSLFETEPVGGPAQRNFLNAAAVFSTTLSAQALLEEIQRIENEQGRVREERWGPRTIDIDLLLYGQETIHLPHLQIPHPRMLERRFVLEPLAQIGPDIIHPGVRRTLGELFRGFQHAP